MKVYICDDSESDRIRLKYYLKQYFIKNCLRLMIKEFSDGESMLAMIEQEKPDLVFLDILMERMNGIQVAEQIRQVSQNLKIVFTTSSPEYAIDAFRVHADGYLCKPFTMLEFESALSRFENTYILHRKTISLMVERYKREIFLDEIIYMETSGHSTIIHTIKGDFRTNRSLSRVKEDLEQEKGFLSCGKSYVVHLEYVKKVSRKEIVLKGGEHIFMPIRLQKELTEVVQGYLAGKI